MRPETDLRDAERKLYLSYFEDGIADMIAGLPILLFGLGMTFDASTFFIFAWMPIMLYWPLKQALTLPRMGHVKFSPARQRKISRNMVMLMLAGLMSLVLGIVAFLGTQGEVFNIRDFMMEYSPLVFGAVMAAAFVLVAILFESRRFFGYGAIVFGGWLAAYLLDINEGIPVAAAGGAIALIGLGILISFLVRHPLASE